MKSSFRLQLVCCWSLMLSVSATCYFPNGNTTEDAPCNSGETYSTCCGPGYACLSNSICALTKHVPSNIAATSPFFVRAGCTDKTWTSQNCPNFCKDSSKGDNIGLGGMGVGKCDGEGQVGRYYCRNRATANISNTALCNNEADYFELEAFPTTVTIIGQVATSIPPSSTPTNSIDPRPSVKNDENITLGLGLGLGIPLLLIVIGLLILWYSRGLPKTYVKSDTSQRSSESDPSPHARRQQWLPYSLPINARVTEELGPTDIHEAPPSSPTYELSYDSKIKEKPLGIFTQE